MKQTQKKRKQSESTENQISALVLRRMDCVPSLDGFRRLIQMWIWLTALDCRLHRLHCHHFDFYFSPPPLFPSTTLSFDDHFFSFLFLAVRFLFQFIRGQIRLHLPFFIGKPTDCLETHRWSRSSLKPIEISSLQFRRHDFSNPLRDSKPVTNVATLQYGHLQ